MFDELVDVFDIILGVFLACFLIYMFWLWIKAGFKQWDVWDKTSNPKKSQIDEKMNSIKWMKSTLMFICCRG